MARWSARGGPADQTPGHARMHDRAPAARRRPAGEAEADGPVHRACPRSGIEPGSRTVGRVVRVRVEQADRLPRPELSRPPTTGTVSDGGASSGRTWSAPWPGDPWRWRYSRSSRGSSRSRASSRSSSEPAPDSTMTSPAVACGTNTDSRPSPSPDARPERGARRRSGRPARGPIPVRTVSSRVLYGKMLRIASRIRPRPPIAGADS